MRSKAKIALNIFILCILFCISCSCEQTVTINSSGNVFVRLLPENGSKAIRRVTSGTVCTLLEEYENGWFRVELKDGATGFIPSTVAIKNKIDSTVTSSNSKEDLFLTPNGVKLGMTLEEVQSIEAKNNNKVKGSYEREEAYQYYFENEVYFSSLRCNRMEYDFDKENKRLFQVFFVTHDGEPAYKYLKTLSIVNMGKLWAF